MVLLGTGNLPCRHIRHRSTGRSASGQVPYLSKAHGRFSAAIVVEWYLRWRGLKKAFPLADQKAQVLICLRVCLFTIYTWFALVYVHVSSFDRVAG